MGNRLQYIGSLGRYYAFRCTGSGLTYSFDSGAVQVNFGVHPDILVLDEVYEVKPDESWRDRT